MTFYSDLATTARTLISDYGQSLVLRSVDGAFDGVTGAYTSSTTTNTVVNAVKIADNEQLRNGERGKFKQIAGGTVEGTFEQWLLDDTAEPNVGDYLIINGFQHAIIEYETISPGGTNLAYKVIVNR